jgi:hypothetical protein
MNISAKLVQIALQYLKRATPRGREEEDELTALIYALEKLLDKKK